MIDDGLMETLCDSVSSLAAGELTNIVYLLQAVEGRKQMVNFSF